MWNWQGEGEVTEEKRERAIEEWKKRGNEQWRNGEENSDWKRTRLEGGAWRGGYVGG